MVLVPNIPGRTAPLLGVVEGNAGLTGFALLLTAVAYTAHGHQLSLYHAIFIIHILLFTGITVVPAGRYRRISASKRALLTGLLAYGNYLLFTAYAIYVWANAPTFGTDHACNNQIKYFFFFHPIPATREWLRKLWMAGLGTSLCILIVFPILGTLYYWNHRFQRNNTQESEDAEGPDIIKKIMDGIFKFSRLLVIIYGVVTLELYVKANHRLLSDSEQDWGFGQILALVQLFGIFNEALHCLMSLCSTSCSAEDERTSIGSSRDSHRIPRGGHSRRFAPVAPPMKPADSESTAVNEAIELNDINPNSAPTA